MSWLPGKGYTVWFTTTTGSAKHISGVLHSLYLFLVMPKADLTNAKSVYQSSPGTPLALLQGIHHSCHVACPLFSVCASVLQSFKKMNPFCIPFAITNMSSALLAMDLGFMGPNYNISTACATGNYCILK